MDSPPPSWYDPPEARHENGSIIRPECQCEECHAFHVLTDNYGDPDSQCCTDEVDERIAAGEWCKIKPLDHADWYLQDGLCLECEDEKANAKEAA